jgi:cullin-associated NEDD8-dissociated protein 1
MTSRTTCSRSPSSGACIFSGGTLIESPNGSRSGLFVSDSIGILVTKVQDTQVADICKKLSELILNGKPELRDIYAIGLKTILADVSPKTGAFVATNLCERLVAGIAKDAETGVKSETLDILTDLLRRFGHACATEHEQIMNLLVVQLTDASPLVRKRATACVGSLGVMASDPLLTRLIDHLIKGIQIKTDSADKRTLIQTVGTLSRSAGHRLGNHLDAIIPILADFCGDPEDEAMQNESSDELRENCFQAFESFVVRCHSGITPHIDRILKLVVQFSKYDPNYNYGATDEEDDDPMDGDDDEDYSDADDGDDYSDDDDTSWKVRRAALRVIAALITTREELLEQLYTTTSPLLISRFKEREENVRVDVFTVFAELLGATRKALPTDGHPPSQAISTCLEKLKQRTKAIVLAANKQFGPKASVASRCAVLALLTELTLVLRGELGEYVDVLMPNLVRAAEDKHSDLKLETMIYLRLLIDTHKAEPFVKHMSTLVGVSLKAVSGDWYKTVAKALGLIESLVFVLRPDAGGEPSLAKQHAIPLFDGVLPSLKAHDIDQEIKEAVISCAGQLVARAGDELGARVNEVFPVLMERLNNEITRVQSMKAIAVIARSPLAIDLSPILADVTSTLSQLLRQQSRTLKQATLDALNDIVVHHGKSIKPELLAEVVTDASALLVDSDMQLCRLGITLISNVLKANPSVVNTPAVQQNVVTNVLALAQSAMIQGATLTALKEFFGQLTQLSGFGALFAALTTPSPDLSRQATVNVARCVASVCFAATDDDRHSAFTKFVAEIQQPSSEKNRILALYCLGEFGRVISITDNNYADVKPVILENFNSSAEDVKSAAAYALGSICVGNKAEYLETIVRGLEQGENSYLLLTALREVISHHGISVDDGFSAYIDRVLPVLQTLSEREEEGVRNLVAACLGKLAVTDSTKLVPVILELTVSQSVHSRWTGVTSIKNAVTAATTSGSTDVVRALFVDVTPFVKTLEDEDVNVRRAALLALNTSAHHQSTFLAPHMKDKIFPVLLKAAEVKMERVVDLGPFKHKVDDALPLRKAAYACADTLLDVLPQHLEVAAFFPYLQLGLKDHDDVQTLCHQIVIKICVIKPGVVVGSLDMVLEPLEKTVNKKIKEDQVGTEVERAKDLIRSGLRVVEALSQVRDTDTHPKFHSFHESVKKNASLAKLLEEVKSE